MSRVTGFCAGYRMHCQERANTVDESIECALTFRYAAATDYAAVLDLACQLARQIEAEGPRLTTAQFETYYVGPHPPMRLLLALHDQCVVGLRRPRVRSGRRIDGGG